ncbi:MAG: hypothetical protein NUV54_03660 [Candidatus Taylorbacteria bacterium]|nr:hypothetical protein [Candidatus Taylorbacteria bacterium]
MSLNNLSSPNYIRGFFTDDVLHFRQSGECLMKMIRITSVPIGQAPYWVREQWLGLELPVAKNPSGARSIISVLGEIAQSGIIEGYPILVSEALRILNKRSTQAASWWRASLAGKSAYLVFGKNCCEYIDTDQLSVTE